MAPSPVRLTLLPIAAAALLGVLPGHAGAATLSCGDTVSAGVTLTNDLVGCAGDGLDVGADGVVIRLNGHSISAGADNSGNGIGFQGHSGVQVVGPGTIQGFGNFGLAVDGPNGVVRRVTSIGNGFGIDVASHHDQLLRNVVRDAQNSGISVCENNGLCHDDLLDGNQVVDSVGNGLDLEESSHQTVRNNKVSGSGYAGILLLFETSDTVTRNTLTGNDVYGFTDFWGTGNTVTSNTATGSIVGLAFSADTGPDTVRGNRSNANDFGYTMAGRFGGTVVGNSATGSRDIGMRLMGVQNTLVQGNTIGSACGAGAKGGNQGGGILVLADAAESASPLSVTISGNKTCGNTAGGLESLDGAGIEVTEGDDITLTGNTSYYNEGDGIQANAGSGSVGANRARHNDGWGIEAFGGLTDAGGNHASANLLGQCSGVSCTP